MFSRTRRIEEVSVPIAVEVEAQSALVQCSLGRQNTGTVALGLGSTLKVEINQTSIMINPIGKQVLSNSS